MTDFFLASFYGDKVMTDKEARLAQPESAPTWIEITTKQGIKFIIDPTKEADRLQAAKKDGLCITPLYTAPPKKEWVGLTDKEVVMLAYQSQENECTAIRLAEQALKEKNS